MNLFQILLIIHIIGGSLSLLTGIYQLVARKGTRKHKRIGRIFYYSMLVAAIVALPMSYIHPNYFLFLIGFFTIYMLLTGTRLLRIRAPKDVKLIDWLLTVGISLFALFFISIGIRNLLNGNSFGIVFIVFGALGLLFSYQDYTNFRGRSGIQNFYLTTHLQRMTGSYIASSTAFLVVNNHFLPAVLVWLLPTIIIVPFIIHWSKKYKRPIKIIKKPETL